jgi:hypothetical protein
MTLDEIDALKRDRSRLCHALRSLLEEEWGIWTEDSVEAALHAFVKLQGLDHVNDYKWPSDNK